MPVVPVIGGCPSAFVTMLEYGIMAINGVLMIADVLLKIIGLFRSLTKTIYLALAWVAAFWPGLTHAVLVPFRAALRRFHDVFGGTVLLNNRIVRGASRIAKRTPPVPDKAKRTLGLIWALFREFLYLLVDVVLGVGETVISSLPLLLFAGILMFIITTFGWPAMLVEQDPTSAVETLSVAIAGGNAGANVVSTTWDTAAYVGNTFIPIWNFIGKFNFKLIIVLVKAVATNIGIVPPGEYTPVDASMQNRAAEGYDFLTHGARGDNSEVDVDLTTGVRSLRKSRTARVLTRSTAEMMGVSEVTPGYGAYDTSNRRILEQVFVNPNRPNMGVRMRLQGLTQGIEFIIGIFDFLGDIIIILIEAFANNIIFFKLAFGKFFFVIKLISSGTCCVQDFGCCVLEILVDFIIGTIIDLINAFIGAFISLLTGPFSFLGIDIEEDAREFFRIDIGGTVDDETGEVLTYNKLAFLKCGGDPNDPSDLNVGIPGAFQDGITCDCAASSGITGFFENLAPCTEPVYTCIPSEPSEGDQTYKQYRTVEPDGSNVEFVTEGPTFAEGCPYNHLLSEGRRDTARVLESAERAYPMLPLPATNAHGHRCGKVCHIHDGEGWAFKSCMHQEGVTYIGSCTLSNGILSVNDRDITYRDLRTFGGSHIPDRLNAFLSHPSTTKTMHDALLDPETRRIERIRALHKLVKEHDDEEKPWVKATRPDIPGESAHTREDALRSISQVLEEGQKYQKELGIMCNIDPGERGMTPAMSYYSGLCLSAMHLKKINDPGAADAITKLHLRGIGESILKRHNGAQERIEKEAANMGHKRHLSDYTGEHEHARLLRKHDKGPTINHHIRDLTLRLWEGGKDMSWAHIRESVDIAHTGIVNTHRRRMDMVGQESIAGLYKGHLSKHANSFVHHWNEASDQRQRQLDENKRRELLTAQEEADLLTAQDEARKESPGRPASSAQRLHNDGGGGVFTVNGNAPCGPPRFWKCPDGRCVHYYEKGSCALPEHWSAGSWVRWIAQVVVTQNERFDPRALLYSITSCWDYIDKNIDADPTHIRNRGCTGMSIDSTLCASDDRICLARVEARRKRCAPLVYCFPLLQRIPTIGTFSWSLITLVEEKCGKGSSAGDLATTIPRCTCPMYPSHYPLVGTNIGQWIPGIPLGTIGALLNFYRTMQLIIVGFTSATLTALGFESSLWSDNWKYFWETVWILAPLELRNWFDVNHVTQGASIANTGLCMWLHSYSTVLGTFSFAVGFFVVKASMRIYYRVAKRVNGKAGVTISNSITFFDRLTGFEGAAPRRFIWIQTDEGDGRGGRRMRAQVMPDQDDGEGIGFTDEEAAWRARQEWIGRGLGTSSQELVTSTRAGVASIRGLTRSAIAKVRGEGRRKGRKEPGSGKATPVASPTDGQAVRPSASRARRRNV